VARCHGINFSTSLQGMPKYFFNVSARHFRFIFRSWNNHIVTTRFGYWKMHHNNTVKRNFTSCVFIYEFSRQICFGSWSPRIWFTVNQMSLLKNKQAWKVLNLQKGCCFLRIGCDMGASVAAKATSCMYGHQTLTPNQSGTSLLQGMPGYFLILFIGLKPFNVKRIQGI
jgi:hypothetical protein